MKRREFIALLGVNRDLAASVAEVAAIVTAERLRRTRQIGLAEFVNHLHGS